MDKQQTRRVGLISRHLERELEALLADPWQTGISWRYVHGSGLCTKNQRSSDCASQADFLMPAGGHAGVRLSIHCCALYEPAQACVSGGALA